MPKVTKGWGQLLRALACAGDLRAGRCEHLNGCRRRDCRDGWHFVCTRGFIFFSAMCDAHITHVVSLGIPAAVDYCITGTAYDTITMYMQYGYMHSIVVFGAKHINIAR